MLVLGLILVMALGLTRDTAYAADGDLDPSFGGDCKFRTDYEDSSLDYMNDLVIQPDGKILAFGDATVGADNNYDMALIRYLPNGDLDATFGDGGKVHTDFGSDEDEEGFGLALHPDGKIVGVGRSVDPFLQTVIAAVVSYLQNGELVTTFVCHAFIKSRY